MTSLAAVSSFLFSVLSSKQQTQVVNVIILLLQKLLGEKVEISHVNVSNQGIREQDIIFTQLLCKKEQKA